VSAAILDATYGYKVQDKQDSLVDLAEQVMKDFSGAVEPGAHAVVDTFPWSTYLTIAIQLGRYRWFLHSCPSAIMDPRNRIQK
jgi:hypothetical protein